MKLSPRWSELHIERRIARRRPGCRSGRRLLTSRGGKLTSLTFDLRTPLLHRRKRFSHHLPTTSRRSTASRRSTKALLSDCNVGLRAPVGSRNTGRSHVAVTEGWHMGSGHVTVIASYASCGRWWYTGEAIVLSRTLLIALSFHKSWVLRYVMRTRRETVSFDWRSC
jgi:hypothetical protein